MAIIPSAGIALLSGQKLLASDQISPRTNSRHYSFYIELEDA